MTASYLVHFRASLLRAETENAFTDRQTAARCGAMVTDRRSLTTSSSLGSVNCPTCLVITELLDALKLALSYINNDHGQSPRVVRMQALAAADAVLAKVEGK